MALFDSPQLWLNAARVATLLFTAIIAWITYRSYLLINQLRPNFNLLLSLPESIARIMLVFICLGIAWLSGLPTAQLGLTVTNVWGSIGLGLGAGLIIQVGVYSLTFWAINRFGRHIYSPWLIKNILPTTPRQWILIALAFIPPIAMEELLFRTLWIGLFRDIVPLLMLVTGTSIIFGLMHWPQGILGALVAGTINVLFSLLFIWSGQLLLTLVAHYTVNMAQIIAAHFQRDWLESY